MGRRLKSYDPYPTKHCVRFLQNTGDVYNMEDRKTKYLERSRDHGKQDEEPAQQRP